MQNSTLDIRQYLFILQRRWMLCMAVFLTVLALGIIYCLVWPKTYEATALIVVQPQKVPDSVVRPTITTKIEERLQIITQQVLSRSRLTEIIERFDLYPELRGKVAPDELAERMRRDITIKITRQNYFTISFIYKNAEKVATVANSLAAFYVDSNLRLREQDAQGTARFLTRELEGIREKLKEWDQTIAAFKEKNLHELPENQDKNLSILAGLQNKIESTKFFLNAERGLISQEEARLANLTAGIEDLKIRREMLRRAGGSAQSSGQGEQDPEAIKRELERLRVFYTDSHPDIQRLARHLMKAEAQKASKDAKLEKEGKNPAEGRDALDLELGSMEDSRQRTALRVAEAKKRVEDLEHEKTAAYAEMEVVRRRIENGPAIAEKLQELTRGYEVLKRAHDKMYADWQDARMAASLERTQRGEQFEVVDPAQKPDSPHRPDVRKALPISFSLGLMLAVGLAFGLNYIDTSCTSVEQIERAAELPVLLVLPPLFTAGEVAAQNRRMMLAGVVYGIIFLVELGLMGALMTGRAGMLTLYLQSLTSGG